MLETIWPPVIRPEGAHRVGDTVRITWAHTNLTDEVQRDAVLRLGLPSAVTVLAQHSSLRDPKGVEHTLSDLVKDGEVAAIGDIAPGQSVWLDLIVSATTTTPESGAPVALTLTCGGREILTDPVAIHVRGLPDIEAEAPQIISHKSEEHRFGAVYRFRNAGTAAATNLSFSLGAPAGFLISRVQGVSREHALAQDLDEVFDNGDPLRRIVTYQAINPGQLVQLGLEFTAGPNAVGDSIDLDNAIITYGECMAIVPAASITLSSHLDFSQSTLTLHDEAATVAAGQLVRLVLHVVNSGRSDAHDVRVAFRIPHELLYADGTLAINEGVDARRNDLSDITLPLVRGNSVTTVSFHATVRTPIEPHTLVQVFATINDEAVPTLEFDVDARAWFPISENFVVLSESTTVATLSPRNVLVRIHNAGAAIADGVRVRIEKGGLTIDRALLKEDDGRESMLAVAPVAGDLDSNLIDVGSVPPRETRMLALTMSAPESFENARVFSVRAYLRNKGEGELALGGVDFHGRSWPAIDRERSSIHAARNDEIRIGQHRMVTIRLENTGSAPAEHVIVDLDLPPTLRATHAEHAELDGGRLIFPIIPACSIAQASVRLEVAAAHDGGGALNIRPVVCGPQITAFRMLPLTLVTSGRVVFEDVATTLEELPASGRVHASLRFTNTGDRAARNVLVMLPKVPHGYVPSSTRVRVGAAPQEHELDDFGATTLLAQGLLIPELSPGTEIAIAFDVELEPAEELTVSFAIECDSLPRLLTDPARFRRSPLRRLASDRARDLSVSAPRVLGQTAIDPAALAMYLQTGPERRPRELGTDLEPVALAPAATSEPPPPVGHADYDVDVEALQPASVIPHDDSAFQDIETSTEPLARVSDSLTPLNDEMAEDLDEPHNDDRIDEAVPLAEAVEPATETLQADRVDDPSPMIATDAVDDQSEPSITAGIESTEAQSPAETLSPDVDDAPATTGSQGSSATRRFDLPVGRLALTPQRLERIGRFIELLSTHESLGMYRHLLAMRLFLPERIDGLAAEVADRYATDIASFAGGTQLRMVGQLVSKSFTPTEAWAKPFESDETLTVAHALHRCATAFAHANSATVIQVGTSEVFGAVTARYLGEYATAQVGAGHFHRMLAELLPSESLDYPELGLELAAYRAFLIDALDAFVYQGPTPRHESLLRTVNHDLDLRLDAIANIVALHSAHPAVA